MNKIFAMAVASLMAGAAMAEGPAEFKKGEFIGNLGIGVGVNAGNGVSGATFTQKVGFEYAVCNFGKKMTLGIGFTAANSYGGRHDAVVAGTYNYSYNITAYTYERGSSGRWGTSTSSLTGKRKGFGTATATCAYDDLKLLPMVSFHYQVLPALEIFASVGGGVSIMNGLVSDLRNYQGFESKTKTAQIHRDIKTYQYSLSYSYDDKAHAKFDGGYTKVGGAFAVNVGARYYFSEHWAVFSEFGITAVSIKTDYPKSWDLFNVGATYKF